MVRVKDTFIALDNIKRITFMEDYTGIPDCAFRYLAIKYFYDDELTKIEVENYQQFEEFAQMIVNAKWMKEKGE